MSVRELAKFIDKECLLPVDGMEFPVKVADVKQSYGNLRCLVHPIGGTGGAWVDASRLGITGEDA